MGNPTRVLQLSAEGYNHSLIYNRNKMGKLLSRLEKQLKTEYKQDAEDCLKIYNKLKDLHDGHVWESNWNPLVNIEFIGSYPNYERRFKPTSIGYIFLNGLTTSQDV